MKLLLIVLVCAAASCGGDPSEGGLFRHMRRNDGMPMTAGSAGEGGSPGAGSAGDIHLAGAAGAAGAQAGSGSLAGDGGSGSVGSGGEPQGGAPSAGQGGSSGEPAAGVPSGGQAGAAGAAGLPNGGDSGSAGAAGQPVAGQSGTGSGGSAFDYFQGCPAGNGLPGAPSWQPEWDGGSSASPEYIAGIPLHGQVQAACGIFNPAFPATDACLWVCRDAALCKQFPPDGSVHQTLDNQNAWGFRPYCDCSQSGNNCATAPH